MQIDTSNKALIENLTLQLSAAAVALHQAQESKGTKPENSAVITGKKNYFRLNWLNCSF